MRPVSATTRMLALFAVLCFTSACAAHRGSSTANADDAAYASAYDNDPIEPFNRAMFRVNQVIDTILLKPLAQAYRFITPKPVRMGVHNVLQNVLEPITFVNALLQGDPNATFTSFWRFALNSTLGFGGIRDFAAENGLPYHTEDFGQTLGHYGAGPGFYLYLPIIGPSNGRDIVGRVGDYFADPVPYVATGYWVTAQGAATVVDTRERNIERIDEIFKTSLDPYATIRSAYGQRRESEISNGKVNPNVNY